MLYEKENDDCILVLGIEKKKIVKSITIGNLYLLFLFIEYRIYYINRI